MEKEEILILLDLLEKIQYRIRNETDETVVRCLESDISKVRNEIGKRVLELPLDVKIFDEEDCIDNISNDFIKGDSSPCELPKPTTDIQSDITRRFQHFLETKGNHPKSKLPVRLSK